MQTRISKTRWYLCCGLGLLSVLYVFTNCKNGQSGSLFAFSGLQAQGGKQTTNEPSIRVLLREAASRVFVAVDGPFEIRQDNKVLMNGRRLSKTLITAASPPEVGPSHLLIGRYHCDPGEVMVLPKKPNSLKLYFDSEGGKTIGRQYDGYVILISREAAPPYPGREGSPKGALRASSKIDVINVLGLDRYLVGVLDAELYPQFHIETYRAGAITARTYALYEMHTAGKHRSYDLRASERSQVYKGIVGADRNSKASRAVTDTRGIVCTWSSPMGEKIFCTFYSSACGGMTQNVSNCLNTPSIPPLSGGVPCSYCSIGGKAYRWGTVAVSKTEVTERLRLGFPQLSWLSHVKAISVVNSTTDGRPLNLRIVDQSGRAAELNSYAFRLAMGGHRILSNHCKIIDLETYFEFTDGRGFGHGVGMCQWGAEGQARLGRKASEILAYYYSGSHLTRAY